MDGTFGQDGTHLADSSLLHGGQKNKSIYYVTLIGYSKGAEAYIRENGFLIKKEDYRGKEYEALSGAAVRLFGKNPQRFFQRAQVRVIRYEGTEAKVGTEMNVIKDEIFTGPILKLTNDVLAFVRTQIKEHTYLGQDVP